MQIRLWVHKRHPLCNLDSERIRGVYWKQKWSTKNSSKWCCNENMSRYPTLHSVDLSCDLSADKLAPHHCCVQGIGSSMFIGKDHVLLEYPTYLKTSGCCSVLWQCWNKSYGLEISRIVIMKHPITWIGFDETSIEHIRFRSMSKPDRYQGHFYLYILSIHLRKCSPFVTRSYHCS